MQPEDTGYAEISDSTVCQSQALTTSDEIIPNETGLQLPRQLNMSSDTAKSILMRCKRGEITQNKAIEEARDYVYAKPTRQQGYKTTKGPDSTSAVSKGRYRILSESESHSSFEETKSWSQLRKLKARKKPEEQKLIRSSFISSTSEWSTTSLPILPIGAQTCSSDSNSSIDMDPVPANKESLQIPTVTTTQFVDVMTQPKEIKCFTTQTPSKGTDDLQSQFKSRQDKMNPNQLQVPHAKPLRSGQRSSVKSTDSGYSEQSQGKSSPPPIKGQRDIKRQGAIKQQTLGQRPKGGNSFPKRSSQTY